MSDRSLDNDSFSSFLRSESASALSFWTVLRPALSLLASLRKSSMGTLDALATFVFSETTTSVNTRAWPRFNSPWTT